MNKVKKIDDICKRYNIKNYVINKDGSVNVNGDVNLCKDGLIKIPLKFNIVRGNCYFHLNNLTSLMGSPLFVNGDFNCAFNELVSLKYSPKEVGGFFLCSYNKLKSLEYGPERVGAGYYCRDNELTTLKNTPRIIYGEFNCNNNNLKTLDYGPEIVYGNYYCEFNELKNLRSCAKHIRDGLYLNNNPDLYTTEGLMCCEPKDIECKNTIFYNVWRLFQDVSKIELFNDMDIIREDDNGKPIIILDRLNEFLDIIGKPKVEYVNGYINI